MILRRPTPVAFVALVLITAMIVGVGAALVLTDPLGGSREDVVPPELSFVVNETRDHSRVNFTENNVTWDGFQIMLDKAGGFWVDDDENLTRGTSLVFTRIGNESPIKEGSKIRFCLDEEGDSLQANLRHQPTGAVVGTFRFSEVRGCTPPESGPESGQDDQEEGEEDEAPDNETASPENEP